MNIDQVVAILLSGGTLPLPRAWPPQSYRGFGALKKWQPTQANMQQACWDSIVAGEEFIDNETVADAIASGDQEKIKAVRESIATRYAEIWLDDMAEQERESGESEADENRRLFISNETRAINRDMGFAS
jgi:hypothetical protein